MKIVKHLLTASLFLSMAGPTAHALPPEEVSAWREDIATYRIELERRHINLFHTVSETEFDNALAGLVERLPELDEDAVLVELMRITRMIGDGHTQIPIMMGPHTHFPLNFHMIGEDIYVSASADEYRSMLGARLVAIDGMPISDVVARVAPAVQTAENAYGLKHSLAFHLTIDNLLFGAGITRHSGLATFTFETADQSLHDIELEAVPMRDFVSRTRNSITRARPLPTPGLALNEYLWIAEMEDGETAYLHFARYPDFEQMMVFADQVAEFLAEREIRNLVIDLRENGGGDFYVGLGLSSAILNVDTLDWSNGIYLLAGRATYSAAMSNTAQFRQILNARIVGEPTGGNPVAYAENESFTLPNSGRMVTYSVRFYRFQADDTPGIQPDIFIPETPEDFRAGRDAALDWVRADIARHAD